jgi:hypothetical protein
METFDLIKSHTSGTSGVFSPFFNALVMHKCPWMLLFPYNIQPLS